MFFRFKYWQTTIEFPDVLVYKDQNNMLQTTMYNKQTDRQNYLDARPENPKSLKGNIPYSQALWIKRSCSSDLSFFSHNWKLLISFKNVGPFIEQQIDKANLQDRDTVKDTAATMPLLFKYNRILPKIKEIVMKHWHLLHRNPNLAEIFQNPPIFAFRWNKNEEAVLWHSWMKLCSSDNHYTTAPPN